MRCQRSLAILAILGLAAGSWYLVRSRIRDTALAGTAHDQPKPHQHHPPHGGTPVVLGDEAFHLELVRDSGAGTLRAYVLDGELEEFVRIGASRLTLEVEREGGKATQSMLQLLPIADLATGETVGNTSLFEARADWLKATGPFKGVFRDLRIHDQTFKTVAFTFPEGNDKD
jgi:hypothetical protein